MAVTRIIGTASQVVIHSPIARDREDVIAWAQANRGFHHPWVSMTQLVSDYAAWLKRGRISTRARYLVRQRDAPGALVGIVNLSEMIRGPLQSCFMGFAGSRCHSGRGLMTLGVDLVLAEAFRTHRLHRVEGNVQPENEASLALLRRCGFREEGFSPRYLKIGGRWRDHMRFAIDSDAWRAARPRRVGVNWRS